MRSTAWIHLYDEYELDEKNILLVNSADLATASHRQCDIKFVIPLSRIYKHTKIQTGLLNVYVKQQIAILSVKSAN